ncbi:regulatory protein, luxR family [Mycolicibacterium rutilum]|uniref:Regulatory protein, luxR family n=1 Tax=Mycolicibacterium rutilum TaxID=370526 RepID=A0A1H6JZH9_MYCRU|nr:AAA family ATPase [Mycolicibacterium rutilum]SEH67927.1 regulatory protein, luxR family [Mycolicibacterium rutilum]
MPTYLANRPTEEAAVAEFLNAASQAPSALLIDGEAGIGKSTLWLAALDRAAGQGFQILSARTAFVESVAAYATLAELLGDVPADVVADLPSAQRVALEQVRGDAEAAPTDQRAVAAAFLSVVEQLAEQAPVLLALDDAQWIDQSSVHVLAYTARRLSGPVGVLGTVRTEGPGDPVSWLQMRRPDAVHRIALRPLASRALQSVVTEHLGRPVPRTKMARIYDISGGNPFYAIELAKVFDSGEDKPLPHTLSAVVQARLDGLEADVHAPLLAAATAAAPTVDLVVAAIGAGHDRTVELLEAAEQQGIIAIEGNRIRFTHPLLATGVYTSSPTDERRQMHRRLAGVVGEPEMRARHLALATTTTGDDETVTALERAAAGAQARGAPAAAAELMELAITLGGSTPERRIRLAAHVFDGGDPGRARTLLERAIAELRPGPGRAQALHLLAVVRFIDDGFVDAVELLQRALAEDRPDGPLRAVVLTTLAYGLYMTGDPDTAHRRAEEAVACAEGVGVPGLLSQALGAQAIIRYFTGGGVDEASMQRALDLEDHDLFAPVMLRPSLEHALILACIGELDASFDLMREIERRCVERGEEGELVFVEFYVALTRIWRGDLATAEQLADNVDELAQQLGGGFPAMLSAVLRAWLAVYRGDEREARRAIAEATDASERSGTAWHRDWTVTAHGLLEVSLGNYAAAVGSLQPLIDRFVPDSTEIQAASYIPDAVEALVELGRTEEAEPLVAALERNGERLDRPWMLAHGARCRALLLAAAGDLRGAVRGARRAVEQHDRLPMPFEQARTTLVLGQLQRRARDHAATASLRQALATFERLGTPLWADRARSALSGLSSGPATPSALTAAESRIAELAAAGLTNRDVANELFLSAKTVEATLARVYRKLGIRSRAELGRLMGRPDA